MQSETFYLNIKHPSLHRQEANLFTIIVLTLTMIGFIALADFFNGFNMSFSIFYLVPISFATYYGKFRTGIVFAFFCALVWLAVERATSQQYTHTLTPIWNSIVRITYFALHTFFMSKYIELYRKITTLSLMDPLTGISNWRGFSEVFNHELQKSRRSNEPLTLIYFDLDNFKKLNDTQGHSAGDYLLKMVAERTSKLIRNSDLFARLGGDEFALLFPETDYSRSGVILDRIFSTLHQDIKAKNWPVTISLGAITFYDFDLSMDEMITKVDNLMYEVKKNGKGNLLHQKYTKAPEPTTIIESKSAAEAREEYLDSQADERAATLNI